MEIDSLVLRFHLPDLTGRNRRLALAVLFLFQTVFFLVFLKRPLQVSPPDNFRYEVPGLNLAQGRGLSMPFDLAPDATVRNWVCSRHPTSCSNEDDRYPTALYPPGYSFLIGGVYALVGRSLAVLSAVHWALLLLLFYLFERMAARVLRPTGYWFVMAVGCAYPFLARQATWFMSDHLHAVLLFGALAALYLLRPGAKRGALFGLLLALATLTRPYCLFVLPVLLLGGASWRSFRATRFEPLIAIATAAVPFLAWAGRNLYWFGRFIPLSTVALGQSLASFVAEHEVGTIYDASNEGEYARYINRYGDWVVTEVNARLTAESWAWMKDHPGSSAMLVLRHIPKVWISLAQAGEPLTLASGVIALYLGTLLVLGVVGGFLVRRDRTWWPLMLTILVYWTFLLIAPEARRTLPLRLPMLLLGGIAMQRLFEAWTARRVPADG